MRHLSTTVLVVSLFLMGQDCETPDPDANPYCAGNDYSILNNVEFGYEQDGISGGLAAILHGDPSNDVRATVYVSFGSSYCTGVALSPTVVLTAGHCGYGADTFHAVYTFKRDEDGRIVPDQRFPEAKHVVHPDYLGWVANPSNMALRQADLMLIFLEEPLPDEMLRLAGFYDDRFAQYCNGLAAQGFGRHEESGRDLRETKYVITRVTDKYLISRAADLPEGEESGRICFGDSGGPLYADVGGVMYLAGVTTTTMSSDCEAGGTHVRLKPFIPWITSTIAAEQTP